MVVGATVVVVVRVVATLPLEQAARSVARDAAELPIKAAPCE